MKSQSPLVVLISGKAGSGKDTFAGMLTDELEQAYGKKVCTTHYADSLKYILRSYFSWDGKKDSCGRELLQVTGDTFRANNEDFFVNFVVDTLHSIGYLWDIVLIPDARFKNEVEKVKAAFKTVTVRVERMDCGDETAFWRRHKSENELDDYDFDYVVENLTLESLRSEADWVASEIMEGCG